MTPLITLRDVTDSDLPIFFEQQRDPVAVHMAAFVARDPNDRGGIAREYWGRGLATAALSQLLRQVSVRPIYAHAAKDNLASLRVLEKCGFTVCGYERSFAAARGEQIDEVALELTFSVEQA